MTSSLNEQKRNISPNLKPPLQPSSEYNLSLPYKIVVDENDKGGAEKLRIQNFKLPSLQELGDNNILIRVKRSGVNFVDTYHRSGLYPGVTQIGGEGSGIILKIGKNVSKFTVNDKVFWFGIRGSYATHVIVADDKHTLKKIPLQITEMYSNDENEIYRISSAIGIQALTAHYLCRSTYNVCSETSVLIHAGAGGTGGLLVQMCKKVLKASLVIVTVGSAEKAKIATKYGADFCILYKTENFYERVMDITHKLGVNVVFDGVGLSTYANSMRCVHKRGMCVYFGNASGAVPSIDPLDLCKNGSIFMTRPTLADHTSKEELNARYDDIFSWIADELLVIHVGHEFELSEACAAHQAIESRNTVGKIVLRNNLIESEIKQSK